MRIALTAIVMLFFVLAGRAQNHNHKEIKQHVLKQIAPPVVQYVPEDDNADSLRVVE